METNSLQHHGIKGQHWGVRRTPEQLGHRIAQKRAKDKISSIKKKEKEKIKIMRAQAKSDSRLEKERVRLDKKYGTSKKTNEAPESETHTQTQNNQHTSINAPKPKTSGWYSSEEGRQATAEMRAKYEYLDYQKRLSDIQPKKVSNGKRLAKFFGTKIVAPAVESVGRQGLEYALGKGVNKKFNAEIWKKKSK